MAQYFFTTQVDDALTIGEEAIVYASHEAAESDALRALIDLANDHLPSGAERLTVTVLNDQGRPTFEAKLSLAVSRPNAGGA